MKPTLFIKKLSYYWAIKEDCDAWNNLGLIGVGAAQGQNGVLDAKQELCDLVQRHGGNLPGEPGFVPSENGRTSYGNGSGFLGWKNFGGQKASLDYLSQYFTLVECGPSSSLGYGGKPEAKPDKKLPGAHLRQTDGEEPVRTQAQILAEVGFEDMAQWEIEDDRKIRDIGDDAELWEQFKEPSNALYAFCVGGEVLYIGKTARGLEKRFAGYRAPGSTQATNRKCHDEIRRYLDSGKTVRIMVMPDRTRLHWGQFRISLAAGLEDSLVEKLRPQLNGKNENRLKTESEEIEEKVESNS
jgi:hypothetical protein